MAPAPERRSLTPFSPFATIGASRCYDEGAPQRLEASGAFAPAAPVGNGAEAAQSRAERIRRRITGLRKAFSELDAEPQQG